MVIAFGKSNVLQINVAIEMEVHSITYIYYYSAKLIKINNSLCAIHLFYF